MAVVTYEPWAQKIRLELLKTPGSGVCMINGCQVITQGGQDGARLHRQACHDGEQWVKP